MAKTRRRLCPCGGELAYQACCARFHAGEEPSEPARLVRARYCAFVRGEAEFLWKTLHADHDDRESDDFDAFAVRVRRTGTVDYRKLTILDHDGPDDEGVARVLFHVAARMDRKDASFMELSYFVHDGEGWRYLVGELATPPSSWKRLSIAEFRRLAASSPRS